jgi:phytoene dehydrogenase-like protein
MIRHVVRDRGDVVVLGAGLAGLSASLAFARSGRRVLLLERDGPGVTGGADRLFECWDRPGIAHFRQPHNFLALGRQVLLDRAPDVLDDVLALGARENRQYELLPAEAREGDERFVSTCARRRYSSTRFGGRWKPMATSYSRHPRALLGCLQTATGPTALFVWAVSGPGMAGRFAPSWSLTRLAGPRRLAPGSQPWEPGRCSSAEANAACSTTAAISVFAMARRSRATRSCWADRAARSATSPLPSS